MNWVYRCSLCDELVKPDQVAEHTELERARPEWPGHMSWIRVDLDADGNPIEPKI